MSAPSDTLRLHLDYTAWATRRLLDTVANLSSEDLTHDFRTSDKTVIDTLAHVFAADRVWLGRIQGNPPANFISPADRQLSLLQKEWPALQERWKQWASPLTDQDVQAKIAYRDLKGNSWEQPLWQILLHVVNHGSHHRGQVSGFLRAMGHNPPALDLIAFYRELG
jgi:uncharacterized damage-inducible protein DinB